MNILIGKYTLSISKKSIAAILFIAIISAALAFISWKYWNPSYLTGRMVLFFLIGLFLWNIRPASRIHSCLLLPLTKKKLACCLFILAAVLFAAIAPMNLNKVWNQEGYGHHQQYQKLTESILDGHLYMDYDDIDPKLAEMENPYDPDLRKQEGVRFHWDHAWYEGHYYMYFGVVPVFLLFLPLKLLGITITECHATQIFTFFIICGIFALFLELIKAFSKKISLSAYLSLAAAASSISLWYAIKCPALYCTAITGGICLAIWGFFFLFKAFVQNDSKHKLLYIISGASFSALVFGCRPTIGFISLSYIPMIIHYLQKQTKLLAGGTVSVSSFFKTMLLKENITKLIAFCIPYIIVAGLLMGYNYLRFDNPFEFGQSYQLTLADQHLYLTGSTTQEAFQWQKNVKNIFYHLFAYTEPSEEFPYIHADGVILLFPILLLGIRSVDWWNPKRHKIFVKGLCLTLFAVVIITCIFQSAWTPFPTRRYSLDFNYLLALLMLLGASKLFSKDAIVNRKISFKLTLFSTYTCFIAFLLFFVPGDSSISDIHPEITENVKNFLIFWK